LRPACPANSTQHNCGTGIRCGRAADFSTCRVLQDETLKQSLFEHVSGSLLNFLEHSSADGRIPILMTPTNPDPFRVLGSNGVSKNQAKPVFRSTRTARRRSAWHVAWLAPHFDMMLRFYDSWTAHNMSSIGLLVWGDDVAIGDGQRSTTFGRPFFSSANLMLNCLYFEDLRASAELAGRLDARRTATVSQQMPTLLRSESRSTAGIPEIVITIRSMFNVSTDVPN